MINIFILAAGNINYRLNFIKAESSSPALLPVNTKPLVAYVLDFYKKHESCCINLVINRNFDEEIKHELSGSIKNIKNFNIISIEETSGVVESLIEAIRSAQAQEECIVNVVTTVPTRFPEKNEVQVSKDLTAYKIAASVWLNGGKPQFYPKKAEFERNSYPFTGVFRTPTDKLETVLSNITRDKYNDLIYVVEKLSEIDDLNFTKVDWIDCGHEINYYKSKNKLISSRSFNSVVINPNGTIKKTSSDLDKLDKEQAYLSMLPIDIAVYFPRKTGDYVREGDKGSFQMEYYGYPNLAEYALYWNVEQGHWHRIFSRLKTILEEFSSHKFSIGHSAFSDFYYKKTVNRINKFESQLNSGHRAYLIKQNVMVNGEKCRSFFDLQDLVMSKIQSLYDENDFCIMHGDFCFNNILYDMPSGIVRLIDQRGSFGEKCAGIYGDRKYDLAKLAHSAIGGYDYIVNGLFNLDIEGNNIEYSLKFRDNYQLISDLCTELLQNLDYSYEDIHFIISLLFLSMTPLHSDCCERQLTMYFHGLKMLNEVVAPCYS